MTTQNKKVTKVIAGVLIGGSSLLYIMAAGGKWLIDNGVV